MTLEDLLKNPGLSSSDKNFIKRWARVNASNALKYGLVIIDYNNLIKDPNLALGNINQARMIREYSVSSAVRYLEVIKRHNAESNFTGEIQFPKSNTVG